MRVKLNHCRKRNLKKMFAIFKQNIHHSFFRGVFERVVARKVFYLYYYFLNKEDKVVLDLYTFNSSFAIK